MRLFGQLPAAVLCGIFLSSVARGDEQRQGAKPSDEPSSLSLETKEEFSGYADTDAVSVVTPAIEATLKNPLAGWSATGSYLVDVVSAASVDIVSTASTHWTEVRHA